MRPRRGGESAVAMLIGPQETGPIPQISEKKSTSRDVG